MENKCSGVSFAFIHVPKTAGTSFSRVISANVGNVYSYRGLRTLLREDLSSYRLFRGHMPYGIHHFVKGPIRYFTFLRNPIEQCISYYYWSRSWAGQPDYQDAVNNDLMGFYEIKRHQNMQTRHIGGYIPNLLTQIVPDRLLLRNAKNRLSTRVAFGIVEHYEESVRRLCNDFGWGDAPIVHVRQAKGRPPTHEVSPEVLQSLRRNNPLDFALYEFACTLFKARAGDSRIAN